MAIPVFLKQATLIYTSMNYKAQKHYIKKIVLFIPFYLNTNLLLKRLPYIVILLAIHQYGLAQTKAKDSLWQVSYNNTLTEESRLNALNSLLENHAYKEQKDSLLQLIDLKYTLAKKIDHLPDVANALYREGVFYINHDKPQLALTHLQESFALNKKLKDTAAMIDCYDHMGLICYQKEDYNEAIGYFNNEYTLAEAIGYQDYCFKIEHRLSIIFRDLGHYSKAIESALNMLKIAEKISNNDYSAQAYLCIGMLYYDQQDYDHALHYFKKGYTIAKDLSHVSAMAAFLSNMGPIYMQKKQYKKAISNFKEAELLANQTNNENIRSRVYLNLGFAYISIENLKEAKIYLNKSLRLSKKISDKKTISLSLSNLGDLYSLNKNYTKAIKLGKEGLKIAEQIKSLISTRNAAQALYTIYKRANMPHKALEMHEKFMLLSDSLTNEKNQSVLVKKQLEYTYAKKRLQDSLAFEQKQHIQKLKLQTVMAKEEKQRQFFYFSAIIIFILGVFGVRAYRSKTKKNKYLEGQNETKTAMMQEIHHRVKNNLQTVNGLLLLQSKDIQDERALESLKEIQNRIISMALVHEKMYQSEDLKYIDARDHITLLVNDLLKTNIIEKKITLDIQMNKINLGIKTLIPLGLIINEIITNAIKYAFNESNDGEIKLHLSQINNTTYKMIIGDNGSYASSLNNSSGIGTMLIKNFTKQLNGNLNILRENGTVYEITFKSIDD